MTITFKEVFETSSSDYDKYDKKPFKVIRQLTDDERDPEVGRMYKIQFEDGNIIDAFADEVEK